MNTQNKNKDFDLTNYEYRFIMSELRPLVEHYFFRNRNDLSIVGIKLINRDDNVATLLVFTNQRTLWSFKYTFANPDNWEIHKLQSSAKMIEITELINLRTNFIEIQGMSESEANEAALKFFIESTTCLQKEEHSKLVKKASKAAQLKKEIEKQQKNL